MPCKHAQSATAIYSVCGLGLYGGKPSHGTCVRCEHNTDRAWHEKQVQVMLTIGATNARPSIAPQSPVQPVPRDKWPIGVKLIAEARKPGDTGVGDIVARKLGKTGEAFKAFMKSIGIDCGCQQRQEWLNQRYPLK